MEGPNILRKLRRLPDSDPGDPLGLAGPLDADGLLPTAQIPYTAITDTFVVADQTERLALTAQKGDVAIQLNNSTAYILQATPASTNGNWVALPQQPYSTSTHGGSGNAGKTLALDAQGKADGRDLQADGAKLDGIASNAIASVTTSGAGLSGAGTSGSPLINSGVTSFNTRSGAITLSKSDVTGTGLIYSDVGAQPLDATLTAMAGLDSSAGLVEQTSADTFTKRAIGVGASTSILTRADGDGRYDTSGAASSAVSAHTSDTTDAHAATAISYSPAGSSNWSPSPDDAAEGLDQLASRVKTLETTPSGVASFNGRTGAVSPADGDYAQDQITGLKTSSSPSFVAITSSVSTGTAPFTVSSTTKVSNLNVDKLDGYDASQTPTSSTIPVSNSGNSQLAQGWIAGGTATTGYVPSSNGDGTSSWSALTISTSTGLPGGSGVLVYSTSPSSVTLAQNETQNLNLGALTVPAVQVTPYYQSTGSSNVTYSSINMTTEAQYTQESASAGTDFTAGLLELYNSLPRTVALLHGDGTNGSTTVTDSGSGAQGHTWSAQNGVTISTLQSKYGGSSWLFTGVNSYLQLSSTSDMLFTGDFTIGCWVYPTTIAGDYRIIFCNSTTDNFQFILSDQAAVQFYQAGVLIVGSSNNALSLNTWQWLALVRSGSTVSIRVDNTTVASGTLSGTVGSSSTSWYWGYRANTGNHPFAGYMDEIIVRNGVADTSLPGAAFAPAFPTTGYWVTTGSALALPVAKISNFDSVTFTQTTPTGTQLRYLVSWDGGTTWKDHSGSTVALADIHTSGSTSTQMSTYFTALTPPGGATSLAWAFGLKSSDAQYTPTLDSIAIQYDEAAPWVLGINGTDYSVKVWTGSAGLLEFKSLRASSTVWNIRAEIA